MKKVLLGLAALLGMKVASAQFNSMNVAGLMVPKYIISGDSTKRMPTYVRLRLQNLNPNSSYRYIIKGIKSSDFASKSMLPGAGNAMYVDTALGNLRYYSGTTHWTAGAGPNGDDTLKSDFMGAYEGWFGLVGTGSASYWTPGTKIYMAVIAVGMTTNDTLRMYCQDSMEVITFNRSTTSSTGTAIWGQSLAKAKNFVAVYDNTSGTGRPEFLSPIEGWSVTGSSLSSLVSFYSSNAHKKPSYWASIVPNGLANGLRRIDYLSAGTGMTVYANTDKDGIWGPSAKNTVNLSGGYWNPIQFTTDDAALVAPKIEFWLRSSTTNEGVGTYKVMAMRRYANEDSSSARFYISGGTATAGASADYTVTERRVKFAGAQTTAYDTILVKINDDNLAEGPESMVFGLDLPTNATIGVERAHTVNVTDNDKANILISKPLLVVKENAGKVGMTIKMDKGVNTASTLSLSVIKKGDSTYIPNEFQLGYNGTDSVITLGKTSSPDSITVYAKVFDDFKADPNDTIIVRVRQTAGDAFVVDSIFTIVCLDNDGPAKVQFLGARKFNVGEKDGSFNIKMLIVSRTDASGDFALRCYTSRSTAIEGGDFKFNPTSKIINITSSTPDTITVNVPVYNDNLYEINKTIYFGLGSLTNVTVDNKDTLIINLINDDLPIYKISTITKQNATTGVADSLNSRCRVYGTVHGVNMRVTGMNFTIIDNTGGIGVYNSPKTFGYTVTEGDSVMVQGRIGQFQGLVQMDQLDTVILLASSKTLKKPTLVTQLGESTESNMIVMRRMKLVDPTEWPSTALAANGFKSVRMVGTTGRVDTMNIDAETNIDGNAAPVGYFDVVGIGGQFDASSPYTSRYVLSPRYLSDITVSTLPIINFTQTTDSLFEPADSFRMDFKIAPADDNFSYDVAVKSATAVSPTDYDFATRKINIIKNTSSVMIKANISDDAVYDGDKYVEFVIRNVQGPAKIGADSVLTLKIKDNEVNAVRKFANSGIKVYPMPSRGTLKIQAKSAISGVNVYSISGAMIQTLNFSNTNSYQELNLDVQSGVYLLEVVLTNGDKYSDIIQIQK